MFLSAISGEGSASLHNSLSGNIQFLAVVGTVSSLLVIADNQSHFLSLYLSDRSLSFSSTSKGSYDYT